jgi:hypothetical protein
MSLIQRNTPAEYSHWRPVEVKLIDDVPVRFSDVCVHEFTLSDIDDVEIYVASPIWEWQQTVEGDWIMKHSVNKPYWIQFIDTLTYGYRIKIMARLSDKDETFWRLKWGGRRK